MNRADIKNVWVNMFRVFMKELKEIKNFSRIPFFRLRDEHPVFKSKIEINNSLKNYKDKNK